MTSHERLRAALADMLAKRDADRFGDAGRTAEAAAERAAKAAGIDDPEFWPTEGCRFALWLLDHPDEAARILETDPPA